MFTTPEQAPENPLQAAIAAPYAHTTAPLRRLVDRFVLLLCHAHVQDRRPDSALLGAIGEIPEIMRRTTGRASDLERRARDVVETAALQAHAGEVFEASVIDRREPAPPSPATPGNGTVPDAEPKPVRVEAQLLDPPLTTWVEADRPLGSRIRVRLIAVDPVARTREFEVVP